MKLLIATGNLHKAEELEALIGGVDLEYRTLRAFPKVAPVEEDAPTLEGNARKKAVVYARETGLWALADDSGLEVDALEGAPGVYSARYAGPDADFAANNRKLLAELAGVEEDRRTARFRCVLALASPRGAIVIEEGAVEGRIASRPRGEDGFGYDPVFYLPERGVTMAELDFEEKNRISHRAAAVERMRPHLERLAETEGRARPCPRCGILLEAWHCRMLCPGCGYQEDCSDVGLP